MSGRIDRGRPARESRDSVSGELQFTGDQPCAVPESAPPKASSVDRRSAPYREPRPSGERLRLVSAHRKRPGWGSQHASILRLDAHRCDRHRSGAGPGRLGSRRAARTGSDAGRPARLFGRPGQILGRRVAAVVEWTIWCRTAGLPVPALPRTVRSRRAPAIAPGGRVPRWWTWLQDHRPPDPHPAAVSHPRQSGRLAR